MKLRKFNRVLQQVSFLPVLTLGVTSGVLYLQIFNANRTVALIQRSDQRISEANLAAKLIVDEETGLRGYQVTGDPRFLQPYLAAQEPLERVLKTLGNPAGSLLPEVGPVDAIAGDADIAALSEAHTAWKSSFALPVIASVRAGGQLRDPESNMRGKAMMDAIRTELAGVVERTEGRRADRIASWREQVRWTEFALFGLAIAAGGLIGVFTRSRMHWVSDRYRESLDDLKQRADEIFESEQRLQTTISSIGDGVITCDPAGRIEMMNMAAQELTGWAQEEARDLPLEQVFRIVNETTRAPVEDPVAKVRRLDRVVGLANHTVLLRRNGAELHIADSGAPIRDKDRQILGFVLVFRDVTMERRTQQALVAQEKMAVAGRLAATIAHEINNPLGSVLDMLYLMRNGVSAEDGRQYMEMAEAELRRVGEIVRAMLGLYRESQAPVSVDLGATMHDILLLVERRFADMGVQVVSKLPPEVCVTGFPAELRQVFTNLMTNAAEAAGQGGEVRVSVGWSSDPVAQRGVPGAAVTIEDNGPGIEEQVLAQLFQPFFTTKGEHGTGLGLWVSKGIVTKHNGSLNLTSSTQPETHGTCARVFLPVDVPVGKEDSFRPH